MVHIFFISIGCENVNRGDGHLRDMLAALPTILSYTARPHRPGESQPPDNIHLLLWAGNEQQHVQSHHLLHNEQKVSRYAHISTMILF